MNPPACANDEDCAHPDARPVGVTFAAQAQEIKGDAARGAKLNAMCIGCHGIPGYQASFPEVYQRADDLGPERQVHHRRAQRLQEGRAQAPDDARHRRLADRAGHRRPGGLLRARKAACCRRHRAAGAGAAAEVAALLAKGACASCHGANSTSRSTARYPKIAGQYPDYLFAALKSYKVEGNPHVGRGNAIMVGAGQAVQQQGAEGAWPSSWARCRRTCTPSRNPSSADAAGAADMADRHTVATLRAAEARDVPAIVGLIRELAEFEKLTHLVQVTPQSLHPHLFGERPAAEAVVAERDGQVIGFALFFTNFSTFLGKPGLYLEDLYVQPAHRGGGVGRGPADAPGRPGQPARLWPLRMERARLERRCHPLLRTHGRDADARMAHLPRQRRRPARLRPLIPISAGTCRAVRRSARRAG